MSKLHLTFPDVLTRRDHFFRELPQILEPRETIHLLGFNVLSSEQMSGHQRIVDQVFYWKVFDLQGKEFVPYMQGFLQRKAWLPSK